MIAEIKKYVAVFIVLILSYISILTVASLIPRELLEENVRSSSKVLMLEGNYKQYFSISHMSNLAFTNNVDATMINTAFSIDNTTPFYSALVARRNYVPSVTEVVEKDYVGDLIASSEHSKYDRVSDLADIVEEKNIESFEYARYWHGYLVYLRPLLTLFDYSELRVIFTCILTAIRNILFVFGIQKAWKRYNDNIFAWLNKYRLFFGGYEYI